MGGGNAAATARPCRGGGATCSCRPPPSAAESSAKYPLASAILLDSATSRPAESTNRRSTTSPSTLWSYKRGGYWIGESGLSGTGGSWSGGAGACAPASSGGGAGLPHAAAGAPMTPTTASQPLT